ncbi:MAG: hypothetical protein ACR2P4_04615 [Gammaproteobacteria bacterium]
MHITMLRNFLATAILAGLAVLLTAFGGKPITWACAEGHSCR